MNWTTTNINEIITRNLVYFDPEKINVCERICKILYIDCFPELENTSFRRLTDGSWERKPIDYSIAHINSAFDLELLDLYEKNDSNIVFSGNQNLIDGVIHFTNYEHPNVYSNIYHNLNIFEKNLRSHLYECGLSDISFIEYLENHELPKTKKEKRIDWLNRRVEDLKNNRDKRPFENTFLSELIDYSISKYHSDETLQKIGTSFLKKDKVIKGEKFIYSDVIKKLRNFIMHHDNISGESVFTPHDFPTFKYFFLSVLVFKEAFDKFREIRLKAKLPQMVNSNKLHLEVINKLNDSEISKYFYN